MIAAIVTALKLILDAVLGLSNFLQNLGKDVLTFLDDMFLLKDWLVQAKDAVFGTAVAVQILPNSVWVSLGTIMSVVVAYKVLNRS